MTDIHLAEITRIAEAAKPDCGLIHVCANGSRSLGLDYPESDYDYALIVQDDTKAEQMKQLLDAFSKGASSIRETKHTHRLLLDWKPGVEITVYTLGDFLRTYLHTTRALAQWSQDERKAYVANVRKCHLAGDSAGKRALKRWAFFELEEVKDLSGEQLNDTCQTCKCPLSLATTPVHLHMNCSTYIRLTKVMNEDFPSFRLLKIGPDGDYLYEAGEYILKLKVETKYAGELKSLGGQAFFRRQVADMKPAAEWYSVEDVVRGALYDVNLAVVRHLVTILYRHPTSLPKFFAGSLTAEDDHCVICGKTQETLHALPPCKHMGVCKECYSKGHHRNSLHWCACGAKLVL